MSIFDRYSEIYNLLYYDKDYSKEVDYILKKINECKSESNKILEYGSGTGIHGSVLVEKGFKVTGIEISEKMYSIALSFIKQKKMENDFKLIRGDITNYRSDEKFGIVLSLFHVISYINSNEGLINTFNNAAHHLEKGGIFIFDVWYSPAVLNLKPQTKIKIFENPELKIIRFTEPTNRFNDNIVEVNFKLVITDKSINQTSFLEETHSMRYFSIPEIRLISKLTSFEIIKVEEFITGNVPSENTWGVCFILRKI